MQIPHSVFLGLLVLVACGSSLVAAALEQPLPAQAAQVKCQPAPLTDWHAYEFPHDETWLGTRT